MFNLLLKIIDSIVWPLVICTLIWLLFFINHGYELDWNSYGVHPRKITGLIGIISMPFLHANFEHLFSNTIPLLLSMAFIMLYFQKHSRAILSIIYLLSGLLLWFIAEENSIHIGASALVYGYITFIISHAFMTGNKEMMAVSFVLIFLYGGLIYGIFPEYGLLVGKNISWEGHLSGMIIGLITAILYKKHGPQKRKYFEDEEEDNDDFNNFDWHDDKELGITYHYKSKNQD